MEGLSSAIEGDSQLHGRPLGTHVGMIPSVQALFVQPRFELVGYLEVVLVREGNVRVAEKAHFRQRDQGSVTAVAVDCLHKLSRSEPCAAPDLGVVVVGDLLFYGIPMFMQDCIDGQYDKRLTDIPEGVDVLITHSPPFGVLDFSDQEPRRIHYGDTILMQKVLELKPRCHLFGHNHSAYGVDVRCGITFSNAAVLDNNYDLVRAPNLIVV